MTKGYVTTPTGEKIAIFAIEGLGKPPALNAREMNYNFTVMTRSFGAVEFIYRFDNDDDSTPYKAPMHAEVAALEAYQEILDEWTGFKAIIEAMAAEIAARKNG